MKFFLGGTPFLAPQSAASPKMTTPALPMTPLFYCRILLHYKNVDVCKKLEVNPLRFDRDIRVLSKKKYFQNFSFFPAANKKRRKSAVFQDFSKKNFLYGQLFPPYSISGLTLMLGGIKKPKKGKI